MILASASALRHALALALDGVRNDDHELLVEQLRLQHAHTITINGKLPLRREANDREYTCFAFALDGVARDAGAEFVTWLMHRRLLRELNVERVKDGDVAIYRAADICVTRDEPRGNGSFQSGASGCCTITSRTKTVGLRRGVRVFPASHSPAGCRFVPGVADGATV